jgi:hypothetical protein
LQIFRQMPFRGAEKGRIRVLYQRLTDGHQSR